MEIFPIPVPPPGLEALGVICLRLFAIFTLYVILLSLHVLVYPCVGLLLQFHPAYKSKVILALVQLVISYLSL